MNTHFIQDKLEYTSGKNFHDHHDYSGTSAHAARNHQHLWQDARIKISTQGQSTTFPTSADDVQDRF